VPFVQFHSAAMSEASFNFLSFVSIYMKELLEFVALIQNRLAAPATTTHPDERLILLFASLFPDDSAMSIVDSEIGQNQFI
jgi:hypothetical protein